MGDRAEASQRSAAVVCALPLALTPEVESRGVPAGCDVPGVLIPTAGTLLPPPPRISQRRAPGMLAELQPVSTQALQGEALMKAEALAGMGMMLRPPSQHCWLWKAWEQGNIPPGIGWAALAGHACSLLHIEIPHIRHKYSGAADGEYLLQSTAPSDAAGVCWELPHQAVGLLTSFSAPWLWGGSLPALLEAGGSFLGAPPGT